MTLEFLELMETMNNTQITKPEKPRRVRGTGIFDTAASTFSFQPMGEGEPVRHNVRKKGESQFFETKGEKQSSYICHLKVSRDSPGVEVWHRRTDRRVVVRMEIETGDEWSMTRQLFNLTQEVTKCFAINQKSLSARQ